MSLLWLKSFCDATLLASRLKVAVWLRSPARSGSWLSCHSCKLTLLLSCEKPLLVLSAFSPVLECLLMLFLLSDMPFHLPCHNSYSSFRTQLPCHLVWEPFLISPGRRTTFSLHLSVYCFTWGFSKGVLMGEGARGTCYPFLCFWCIVDTL